LHPPSIPDPCSITRATKRSWFFHCNSFILLDKLKMLKAVFEPGQIHERQPRSSTVIGHICERRLFFSLSTHRFLSVVWPTFPCSVPKSFLSPCLPRRSLTSMPYFSQVFLIIFFSFPINVGSILSAVSGYGFLLLLVYVRLRLKTCALWFTWASGHLPMLLGRNPALVDLFNSFFLPLQSKQI
jgi:hypothetical protein